MLLCFNSCLMCSIQRALFEVAQPFFVLPYKKVAFTRLQMVVNTDKALSLYVLAYVLMLLDLHRHKFP